MTGSTEDEPLISRSLNDSSSYRRLASKQEEYERDDESEQEIREKLQWYFKDPYQKYKERKRKPFKLIIQILKIILVTIQAALFASDEFSIVTFRSDNIETFRQLFVLNYAIETEQELYLKDDIYQTMYYTWKQYYDYENLMIGSYHTKTLMQDGKKVQCPIRLCVQESVIFERGIVMNSTVLGDVTKDGTRERPWNRNRPCFNLIPPDPNGNKTTTIEEFIEENHLPRNFETISTLKMQFEFLVNYSDVHRSNAPDCYQFNVTVLFDNSDLDGTMEVTLESEVDFRHCRQTSGIHIKEQNWWNYYTLFDVVIIAMCLISLMLCCRSFQRHYQLCKDAKKFFRDYRHERFTPSDQLNFVNFWLVLISISDMSTIAGSVLKIILDWTEYPELYNACTLCFGVAVLLSWIGILRYLGFMRDYNILLLTIKTAFPSVVRFIFCCSFIYLGFAICGWIVFGPYHEKFRSLYVTSECLFALVNGDDMYATFSGIRRDDSDVFIWAFSKIYLYVFISLFIYVVLSLFIGIVADTYERIKDYGHPPKTRIELFMEGLEYNEKQNQHRHGGQGCVHTRGEGGDYSGDYLGDHLTINNPPNETV